MDGKPSPRVGSNSRLVLKCGLSKSQGRKVVGALLKVQDKLHQLESCQNREEEKVPSGSSQVGEVQQQNEDGGRHEDGGHHGTHARQTISLNNVSERLDLIESKLDLVTQLLITSDSSSGVPTPRRHSASSERPLRLRFKINDEDVKRRLMERELNDLFLDLKEEFEFFQEESEILRRKLASSTSDATELQRHLVFMSKTLTCKRVQLQELTLLNEQFESILKIRDSSDDFPSVWDRMNRVPFRKYTGKLSKLPPTPKWR